MSVPPKDDPKWAEIITGEKTYALKFLAAKILLGRLLRLVNADPSSGNVVSAVDELHALYSKNATITSVKDDLQTIFG